MDYATFVCFICWFCFKTWGQFCFIWGPKHFIATYLKDLISMFIAEIHLQIIQEASWEVSILWLPVRNFVALERIFSWCCGVIYWCSLKMTAYLAKQLCHSQEVCRFHCRWWALCFNCIPWCQKCYAIYSSWNLSSTTAYLS